MKFTTLEKILIVLCLALFYAWASEALHPTVVEVPVPQPCVAPAEKNANVPYLKGDDTTLAWLKEIYPILNDAYFDNKLPKDVPIDLNETDPTNMASTVCDKSNVNCRIHFNLRYTLAPRNAELTMLHEMCHIPTFDERVAGLAGQPALHGPKWRACMVKVDIQGANRYILIDGYKGPEVQLGVFQ